MNVPDKKVLLVTTFSAAALFAACDRSPTDAEAAHASAPHYRIEAEVRGAAAEAFAARGDTIVEAKGCDLNRPGSDIASPESCTYDIETAQDDGLIHTVQFMPADNSIAMTGCSLRPNSPVADEAMKHIAADFRRGAGEKAAAMGFTLLDSSRDQNSGARQRGGTCSAFMAATVLLKQDGNLYNARFHQDWSFPPTTAPAVTMWGLAPVTADGDTQPATKNPDSTMTRFPTMQFSPITTFHPWMK